MVGFFTGKCSFLTKQGKHFSAWRQNAKVPFLHMLLLTFEQHILGNRGLHICSKTSAASLLCSYTSAVWGSGISRNYKAYMYTTVNSVNSAMIKFTAWFFLGWTLNLFLNLQMLCRGGLHIATTPYVHVDMNTPVIINNTSLRRNR